MLVCSDVLGFLVGREGTQMVKDVRERSEADPTFAQRNGVN